MAENFNDRLRRTTKDITFTGAAGLGAQGTVAAGTVTGGVLIEQLAAYCVTDLVGTNATIALGVAGATTGLIAQATATDIDATKFWTDATPTVLESSVANKLVSLNIIATVATADITAGRIVIVYYWRPITANGNLA